MNETSKTNRVRGSEFISRYLSGRVIDIGCGDDPVVAWAECFDKRNGDAGDIARLRPTASYDTVYSSHCLEHMPDPAAALERWWSLVMPGGHLITVVPDAELYEQGMWPSMFNPDHKWAFTLGRTDSAAPHLLNVLLLHQNLPQATIVEVSLQDFGYRHEILRLSKRHRSRIALALYRRAIALLNKVRLRSFFPERKLWALLAYLGIPVDQTMGDALAQIQIVARKDRILEGP